MKRIKLLSSLMVLFMAIGFTACDVEPVDPNLLGTDPVDNTPASFQVDFSLDTYQATSTTAVVANGIITITATRTNAGTFTITVPASTGTTATPLITYTPSAAAGGMYTNVSLTGISGSVSIASFNTTTHKVTGTFNFTGYWSDASVNQPNIVFTNGIFTNIAYTGDGVTEPAGDPLFQVKIDGSLYTADSYFATIGNGLISVTGLRGTNGEYVSIVIDGTAEGTYTEEAIFAYSPDGDEDNVYSNISLDPLNDDLGTVTITEIDETNHTISGTFSFTGYLDGSTDKSFTEGKFENIPYTDENTTPTDEVFTATVDGTAMTYAGTDLIVSLVNDTQINLQAIGDDHELRLYINDLGEGTYAFSSAFDATAKAYFTDANDTEYQINNGTLVISSKDDNWIAGTFTYNVVNEAGTVIHTVTNGVFNVQYN